MIRGFRNEDGAAVLVGLLLSGLGMLSLAGIDPFGWVIAAKTWTDPSLALQPANPKSYAISAPISLGLTFVFLLGLFIAATKWAGESARSFALRFPVVFALTYGAWTLGQWAYLAATPDKLPKGVTWTMGLTGEAGYLLALLLGLLIGNFLPGFTRWLAPASRSELFIKTAVVLYGAVLGVKAATETGRASAILFRGIAAIIEAYLIYWALVYWIARSWFKFSREWAAPLASGISICGVSAAITTGAAIRARPVVPVMVSSLVVVFAVVEMLLLPWMARVMLPDQPMVAAAWMGLAVKTDGAAIASGSITEGFFLADAASKGIHYEADWMKNTTTTVKVFIDVFIGIWALVLAFVWSRFIDRKDDGSGPTKLPWAEMWARFPKFVLGYFLTFGVVLTLGLLLPELRADLNKATGESTDQFRRILFSLTFFSIGLAANFRRLWAEGLGKLALVYVVCLFGFIIWIGLAISWLFFAGMLPPITQPGA
ncbi:putative sulfate exporter family transporter [Tuwongella immobilis]|uniref:Sulfate exporter family transporter n=1 Tax=Tuwongella immobilis TaxID=692036 RepID=A0A6C2YVY1_9BACT|nr:putative sulfate exporter family transporter [Tuwongella immobilis]VIP05022.1 membrane protein : Uncharacterized protein family UPF0324 OS=Desulfovibrio desulfuricans ND132 GN=DND132_0182 PE=4 SV=1: Cons_hypoth698 [Tuwongella immobilis]VTS07402.1 membrane protein : Uncharacterized protein family UPF0324 OS=Desulfovibrio desulfuricans ND132 GN=DND132_0182 PE=4 SV=1: Cons_hypoth698 [Tuwongella immobilis]